MFRNIVSSLKNSIEKSKEYLSSGIDRIFVKEKINDSTIEELEELLLSADIGSTVTDKIIMEVRKIKVSDGESLRQVKSVTSKQIIRILEPVEKSFAVTGVTPQVIVFCGINGNGKTTTIGKLSYKLQQEGKKVMIAACDLFRAAAVEQLRVWAERSSALFFSDETSKSASSTAYRALEKAIDERVDILIIDTSGRLHTHNELMEELKKICRVLSKLIPNAPHEVILALDASTGQNALSQVKIFKETVNLTGLVVTKLDGTSKGGVIVALAEKHPELGIYFIGTGEKITDLQEFSAADFATSLLEVDVQS
ncbi:signal recognition particle-docking protein FtsY [Neorickettsia helminthoeca str. Oregon]|uniref:Signal recognition particle-docking protein FtsY n=1 Tax=Neorickettsia helminthoeca str. Oregon TaxID=1286528 RepID=X5H4H6_9RICK|nr:signal recognition particle-docking protein FtsY [Neorickettsia helminthoeca]AHX11466.1 signal recognition particle-docking protein FtsY [Neorickettsia helminthoeca str. Oregon]